MKRILSIILAVLLIVSLAACGNGQKTETTAKSDATTSKADDTATQAEAAQQGVKASADNDILILYFSADNTKDVDAVSAATPPVYLATGENDSYYGSRLLKNAYNKLRGIYESQGLTETEIDKILVLDVKDQAYFTERGYTDQHGGGMAFAHDETIMKWLFKNDST